MDLTDTPAQAAFRAELREWLVDHVPVEPEPTTMPERFHFTIRWQKRLYEGGWVALSWPEAYGGRGLGPVEESILNQELGRAGAPQTISFGFLGRPLLAYGTEDQKQRYLRPFLASEEIWCQGFSEPDAGSDLASLRTRAVPDGDTWVINGQKVWTSRGQFADFCLLLARTGTTESRHKGITAFMVPMRSPGIEVRPLRLANGDDEFAEVFFTDVRIPAEGVVGAVDEGWAVTQETLTYERGAADLGYLARYERLLGRLGRRAHERGLADDATTQESLGAIRAGLEVLRLHSLRRLSDREHGVDPGAESSVDKLLMTELEQRLMTTALEVSGPGALTGADEWFPKYLYSRAGSIYGGTSQIQRNIIARRVLRLPR